MISKEPEPDYGQLIDEVLCAYGRACGTVIPFLRELLISPVPSARRQLAHLLLENLNDLKSKGSLCSTFWEDRPMQAQEVKEWLLQPEVLQHLQNHADELSDDEKGVFPLLESVQSR